MVYSAPKRVTVGKFQGWQVRLVDMATQEPVGLPEGAEGVIFADFETACEIGNEVIASVKPNSPLPAAHGDLVGVRCNYDIALRNNRTVLGTVSAS
jgi:hypothetical protein